MNSEHESDSLTDEARRTLCHRFAQMLNAGSSSVRVRVNGTGAEAWFYAHDDEGWHKLAEAVTDSRLVQAIEDALNMLVAKQHADEWSARQHSSADHRDIDVQFHRDQLEHRLGDQLESALAGLLFRDRHDSRKDKRQAIRTPRPAAAGTRPTIRQER